LSWPPCAVETSRVHDESQQEGVRQSLSELSEASLRELKISRRDHNTYCSNAGALHTVKEHQVREYGDLQCTDKLIKLFAVTLVVDRFIVSEPDAWKKLAVKRYS
jgi:hypothetical protein